MIGAACCACLPAHLAAHLQPSRLGAAKGPHDAGRGGRHLHIHLTLIQLALPAVASERGPPR